MMAALKSRTIWFSILLAVLSVVQGSLHVFRLDPWSQMWAGIAIAVAVAVLRVVTTTPLINQQG